ncbi:hypothetical protein [Clavibacter zhangzhiyongii]|uniref:hypothetical protein n=1 Tax=Clavibacter zhangzhiyongii TaxID=2768071 RepID=UPI0039E1DDEA
MGAGNRAGGVPCAHREATGSALLVDEDPPYGGPAAALGAGVRELARMAPTPGARGSSCSPPTSPHAAAAVAALLPLRRGSGVDGHDALVARDPDGRARSRSSRSTGRIRSAPPSTPSTGPTAWRARPCRAVLAALGPGAVAHADLDARLCADVDLPADADVHGLRLLDDGIPAHGR